VRVPCLLGGVASVRREHVQLDAIELISLHIGRFSVGVRAAVSGACGKARPGCLGAG